ncbi:MAG TPA: hypothetical protein VHE09_10415 [Rhizomicrobium sp.]|jgi:hypothetical protein|nr:hypothetical protein [Rhizomicrobium sp.]
MHEFENIAFLDQQKTGTTTIVKALRRLLAEREIHTDIHGPIPRGFDKDKKCFVSVRDPLSTYISLFKFGAGSRKGTLYSTLRKKGLSDYYEPSLDAFERWLEFVLDPANAGNVSREYADSSQAERMGLLTFRLLYLCVPKARTRLEELDGRNKVERVFAKRRIYSEYVRTEHLYEDLFGVLRHWESGIKLKAPLTTVEDMIDIVRTRNVSQPIEGLSAANVSPRLLALVQEREWLLYKTFGYDRSPSGIPTACLASAANAGVRTEQADRRSAAAS